MSAKPYSVIDLALTRIAGHNVYVAYQCFDTYAEAEEWRLANRAIATGVILDPYHIAGVSKMV